jgi:outer membrane lipopolysaccharide assembly protein LptE/RlpB
MKRLLNVFALSLLLTVTGACGWLDVTPENVIAQDDLFST